MSEQINDVSSNLNIRELEGIHLATTSKYEIIEHNFLKK